MCGDAEAEEMRLRVEPAVARERLAAEVEALGGSALAVGETLELFYPVEDGHQDQERIELTFFVRAWLCGQPDVDAEVLA